MDYSCGFAPGFGGSLRRGGNIRKSLSVSSKYIGGADYVLRTQLAEQLRCMDSKWEMDCAYLGDLVDFYKKRAVLEQEYSDSLNKLVQSCKQKLNTETTKRQNWPKYSYHSLLTVLLESTNQTAVAHQVASEIYSRQMTQRLQDLQEDCTRAHKQTRDLAQLCQATVLSTTSKLNSTYRDYCNSYQLAEDARKMLDKSKEKFDRERKRAHEKNKDIDKSQKIRKLKDDYGQKCDFNTKQNIQTLQSRNEYLIQIAASNASVDKYFGQEIFDLLNCLNLGFHNAIVRAGLNHISCEKALANTHRTAAQIIEKLVQTIDPNRDQLKFLNKNQSAFNKTTIFAFQTIKDDIITCVMSHPSLLDLFQSAIENLIDTIKESKSKFEEYWKISNETTKKLHKLIDLRDYDVEEIFSKSIISLSKNGGSRNNLDCITSRLNDTNQSYLHLRNTTRTNRIDLEKKYFEQFSAFIVENHHFHVLNAKLDNLNQALANGSGNHHHGIMGSETLPNHGGRRDLLAMSMTTGAAAVNNTGVLSSPDSGSSNGVRIFGGSLEEYVSVTHQAIPPLISSTIHVIGLYGFHNQGIFRISGSQNEINELKELYENLQDPLYNANQLPDVNVAAGLLKMYFRELKEPIFSGSLFHKIVELYETERERDAFIEKMAELLMELPRENYVIMRYLFAFLKCLTECKEENMMDSYNLAICLGPCLMPIPGEYNKVLFHMQAIVNEIIRLLIESHELVFGGSVGIIIEGPAYKAPAIVHQHNMASATVSPGISTGGVVGAGASNNGPMGSSMFADEFGEYDEAHSTLTSQRTKCSLEGSDTLEGSGASDSSGGQGDNKLDCPPYFAVAIADFVGQTSSELSFHKEDRVVLEEFVSDHWWHGRLLDGLGEGLIPLAYVQIHSQALPDTPAEAAATTPLDARSTTPIAILQVNHDPESHYLHIGPSTLPLLAPGAMVSAVGGHSQTPSPVIQPPTDFCSLRGGPMTPQAPHTEPSSSVTSGSLQLLSSFGHVASSPPPLQSAVHKTPDPVAIAAKTARLSADDKTLFCQDVIGDNTTAGAAAASTRRGPQTGSRKGSRDSRSVASVPGDCSSRSPSCATSETDIDKALASVLQGLASIQNQNKPAIFRSDYFQQQQNSDFATGDLEMALPASNSSSISLSASTSSSAGNAPSADAASAVPGVTRSRSSLSKSSRSSSSSSSNNRPQEDGAVQEASSQPEQDDFIDQAHSTIRRKSSTDV